MNYTQKYAVLFELPEQAVCIAELDLDLIIQLGIENHQMDLISNFTPIFEDLAFVMDSSLPVEAITPIYPPNRKTFVAQSNTI